VGIFVPCLLLADYNYRLGYITTVGLNPEIISERLADATVESWILGVQVISFGLSKWRHPLAALAVVFIFFLVVVYIASYLKRKGKLVINDEAIAKSKATLRSNNNMAISFSVMSFIWPH